jgi:hypothetical protein
MLSPRVPAKVLQQWMENAAALAADQRCTQNTARQPWHARKAALINPNPYQLDTMFLERIFDRADCGNCQGSRDSS